jgi:hypothetical protein
MTEIQNSKQGNYCFGNLIFGFASDFDIRISNLIKMSFAAKFINTIERCANEKEFILI